VVTAPLIALAIPSVCIGWMTVEPTLIGGYFGNAIVVAPAHPAVAEFREEWHGIGAFMLHGVTTLPFWLALAGIAAAWYLYLVRPALPARIADAVLYTRAGPEIGVASTKAFTTQLVCLYLVGVHLGILHGKLKDAEIRKLLEDLTSLPQKMEAILESAKDVEAISKDLFRAQDFLFLARGPDFPIALEGALKLKELSYIHAEGYPAGEMKHGPNALIDENLPVVFLAAYDTESKNSQIRYEKVVNNVKEVKSRDGIIVSIGLEGDTDLQESSAYYIPIASTNEYLMPILEVIPLQLLAYHIAVRRGCDIDQPRNLAKSVTVE
jgi:glucosamine--fructose-6-phosphate aminotransferase (isomerizing)